VALFEVPAAGADEEDGGVVDEGVVLFGGGIGVGDGAADGVAEVELAVEEIFPGGGGGVFKVGHEDAGAGVEGVDDHLAIDGAGDFYAAVLEVGGEGGNFPRGGADVGGFGEEVWEGAGVEGGLAGDARGEELLAAGVELALQGGEEVDGFGGEDGGVAVGDGRVELDGGGKAQGAHEVSFRGVWLSVRRPGERVV